jgi:hypothetical protein
VHASQVFPNLEWPFQLLADQGARHTAVFYRRRALTLTFSWKSQADGVFPYWARRAFRIAPQDTIGYPLLCLQRQAGTE